MSFEIKRLSRCSFFGSRSATVRLSEFSPPRLSSISSGSSLRARGFRVFFHDHSFKVEIFIPHKNPLSPLSSGLFGVNHYYK